MDFSRAGLVDGIQGQGDFDGFFFISSLMND